MTRAIALRMIHAGEVAASPGQLDEWIARTDDLREKLVKAGYGSAFTAEDLFPLFQGAVGRASSSPAPSRTATKSSRWLWLGVIALLVAVVAFGIFR